MSAVCVLAPVVVAAWPAFSSAVVAAAGSMGYVVADEAVSKFLGATETQTRQSAVALDIPNSQIVTGKRLMTLQKGTRVNVLERLQAIANRWRMLKL